MCSAALISINNDSTGGSGSGVLPLETADPLFTMVRCFAVRNRLLCFWPRHLSISWSGIWRCYL